MKAVIDTNVLVYDTFEDSLYHKEARKLLDDLDVWIIPIIVIHEYVWVLKALKIDAEDVLYKTEEYINNPKTELISESNIIVKALNTIVKENLSLSRYNDKVILFVAVNNDFNIATFDEKLRKQALNFGLKVLPAL